MSSSDDKDLKDKPGHVYDGIYELDNPMPDWWLWTFFISIMFAALYFIHYQFGGGPTLVQELEAEMKEIAVRAENLPPEPEETADSLMAALARPDLLPIGETVYTTYCAACHGAALQGLIGPNLTDKYWLHGKGQPEDIARLVRQGVPEKGMPSWQQMLSKDQVYGVIAYVISKADSNPPGAKPPQGELVN